MLKEQNNPHIALFKDKGKRLHSMLKPRVPGITLGECYNYLARLYGARSWNELSAQLKQMATSGERNKKDDIC